jgi:Arc/MetJ family transcription regulator
MVKEVIYMPKMIKKTIELDQDYIDMARSIFRVRTDKEAVNKALEMVIIDNSIIEAHEQVADKGDVIEKVFE